MLGGSELGGYVEEATPSPFVWRYCRAQIRTGFRGIAPARSLPQPAPPSPTTALHLLFPLTWADVRKCVHHLNSMSRERTRHIQTLFRRSSTFKRLHLCRCPYIYTSSAGSPTPNLAMIAVFLTYSARWVCRRQRRLKRCSRFCRAARYQRSRSTR